MFIFPPDDLDQSAPVEPLKIGLLGEEERTLQGFLTELVDSHPTKLTKDQKHDLRDNYRLILLNLLLNGSEGVYTAISRSAGAVSGLLGRNLLGLHWADLPGLKGCKWRLKSPIKLIYEEHFSSGGRLYKRFQNLPMAQRAVLTINDQPTVELDYKANHPRVLKAMNKTTPANDPYTDIAKAVEVTRAQAKAYVTCSLGSSIRERAFGACKRHKSL